MVMVLPRRWNGGSSSQCFGTLTVPACAHTPTHAHTHIGKKAHLFLENLFSMLRNVWSPSGPLCAHSPLSPPFLMLVSSSSPPSSTEKCSRGQKFASVLPWFGLPFKRSCMCSMLSGKQREGSATDLSGAPSPETTLCSWLSQQQLKDHSEGF